MTLHAADLSGSNDPQLQEAIELWLEDDDRDSLGLISSLAQAGNVAARLLLARIEFTDRASTSFVNSLSRAQRMELFRPEKDKGPFRESWIGREARGGNPIAQSLASAISLGIDIPAIESLYALGESDAAEHLVRKVAVDGSDEQRDALMRLLPPGDELVPYLRGFRYARAGQTTGRAALRTIVSTVQNVAADSLILDRSADTRMAAQFVDMGYQAGSDAIEYESHGEHYNDLARWLADAPEALPIRSICDAMCDDVDRAACAVTAFGLLGGYYELIRIDTPLHNLISRTRFLSSLRATHMTLRRIIGARTEAGGEIFSRRELIEKSECLADALTTLGTGEN
ncbi:MAG: hypothetical protein AAF420_04295 [Pseudomonadota bacterium]